MASGVLAVTGNHDCLGGLVVTPAGKLADYDHGATWLQCPLGERPVTAPASTSRQGGPEACAAPLPAGSQPG